MASTKEELLSLCVDVYPEGTVDLESGVSVVVKALKGSESARVSSMMMRDEQILYALPRGIVEPKLTSREIQTLLDKAPDSAMAILVKILDLSGALGEAEAKEDKDAEKN